MRKGILVTALAVVMVAVGLVGSPKDSNAAFHFMRVYGGMGGAFGDTNIQYVELRMTTGGQNFVASHDICFYDATGAPYAIFNFPSSPPNGTGTASILVGSSEFDTSWAAGSPDFTFSGATVTQIAALADVNHPIRLPAGKISFGTETSVTPASMCQAGFTPFLIDSVAYGTGYTGTVNFGTRFNTDMPSAGTQAVRLTGPLCSVGFNCAMAPNNSTDYSLLDVNVMANHPRNNANLTGPLSAPDTDGDGVLNPADLCPSTAPAAPVDANGCSQAQVDSDLDGFCNPGAPSAGPSPGCTGTDNCPDWENPLQDMPLWTVPSGDTDCDGYHATSFFSPRAPESSIGTVANQHCAATQFGFDEPLPDAWPPDINDNQLVNGSDILAYNSSFGSSAPGPPYTARLDLNGNGLINGADILQFNPFFGKRCKPLP